MLYIFIESEADDSLHTVIISPHPADHADELQLQREATTAGEFPDYVSASVRAQCLANTLRLGGASVRLH